MDDYTKTFVWRGPLVNGKQPNVPHPPATNGIIVQVRPEDTTQARKARRDKLATDHMGRVHDSTFRSSRSFEPTGDSKVFRSSRAKHV